jgi:dTDP-4-dehydrorhamnose reductase
MAKICIIGANGMLGSTLSEKLIPNHDVIASGKEVDVTDTFLVTQWAERLFPDYIVNCSAFNDVDGPRNIGTQRTM